MKFVVDSSISLVGDDYHRQPHAFACVVDNVTMSRIVEFCRRNPRDSYDSGIIAPIKQVILKELHKCVTSLGPIYRQLPRRTDRFP
jgi:hypothetical protein